MGRQGDENRQEILDLVRRWAEVELRGDVDACGELLAEDFLGIGPARGRTLPLLGVHHCGVAVPEGLVGGRRGLGGVAGCEER